MNLDPEYFKLLGFEVVGCRKDGKPKRISPRVYELPEAAEQFAELARKSGFRCVEVWPVIRGKHKK